MRWSRFCLRWSVLILALSVVDSRIQAQEGLLLSGVGPINRSMGGASTAAPIDASGALHWNPASIMGLPQTELQFGVELLYPQMQLGSSIGAGSLGGGFPPVTLSGNTDGNSGLFTIPTVGFVYRRPEARWAFGLGVFGIGGFGTNYAGSFSNPILTATPPNGLGLGPLYSKLQLMQIAPTLAYQLTDQLSVGIAPTITAADLSMDPNFLASPDDANLDTFSNYPSATHGRTTWGLGLQAGIYLTTEGDWDFGASIKSPQWMQTFHWSASDEVGNPRDVRAHFDIPYVASIGTSYKGFEGILIAVDARLYGYGSTQGFRTTGFDATGAVTGLGWNDIFSVAMGAQYQATDDLSLRIGYVWNQNPIPDQNTFFNVISPNILMHTISCGLSYRLTESLGVSLAYVHGFENSISGPMYLPGVGALAGTSVTSKVWADVFIAGLTMKF